MAHLVSVLRPEGIPLVRMQGARKMIEEATFVTVDCRDRSIVLGDGRIPYPTIHGPGPRPAGRLVRREFPLENLPARISHARERAMFGQTERGRGSILKVMTDDEVRNRLDAARARLVELEGFVPDEPAKLTKLRTELDTLQGMVQRNEKREGEIVASIRGLGDRPSGVFGKVSGRQDTDQDSRLSVMKGQLATLREGRARLNQQIAHIGAQIVAHERDWAAEMRMVKVGNVEKLQAARVRVGELEEANRLLVRPTPENRAMAYDLARSDFERVLRDRVMKATSVRQSSRDESINESFGMTARA